MCIASSGEVISIEGSVAKVSHRGNVTNVNIGMIEPKVGDHVLVHAGCALQIISKDDAKSMDDIYNELLEVMNENA